MASKKKPAKKAETTNTAFDELSAAEQAKHGALSPEAKANFGAEPSIEAQRTAQGKSANPDDDEE